MMTKKNISVLGAGSWGSALAFVLNESQEVTLWGHDEDHLNQLKIDGENVKYLPGVPLKGVQMESSLENACKDKDVIVIAIPTKYLRAQLQLIDPLITDKQYIVCVSKGIEVGSFKLVSEIADECLHHKKDIIVLSGPSHAEEVGKRQPTAVTSACVNIESAESIQKIFMTEYFRVYANTDVVGVEIGGAIKNIIAIAAGVSDGLGFGKNALAALLTRGLVEIRRFGAQMGADDKTFYGLSGLGDLVATCASQFSRNRHVGIELAKGKSWKEIEGSMDQVAEGVSTVQAVYAFSQQKKVDMPITEQVYKVLFENADPRKAMIDLMTREARAEH